MAVNPLSRFKHAQDELPAGFSAAVAELEAGRKTSHWIWYIFPQLAGLGSSYNAKYYGIADLAEAKAYVADPVLGSRLGQVTALVAQKLKAGVPLRTLMGSEIDAVKVVSSLTLFLVALEHCDDAARDPLRAFRADCVAVLTAAADQGYPRCAKTQESLAAAS